MTTANYYDTSPAKVQKQIGSFCKRERKNLTANFVGESGLCSKERDKAFQRFVKRLEKKEDAVFYCMELSAELKDDLLKMLSGLRQEVFRYKDNDACDYFIGVMDARARSIQEEARLANANRIFQRL